LRSAVLFLWLVADSTFAEQLTGKVVGVSDGDTITILDQNNQQHKIRVGGIDAPELKQAFGNVAKKNLSDLVFNQTVLVEWNKTDKYKRIVGKVLAPPTDCPICPADRDVGLAQVEAGMAWWYREYRKEQTLEDQGYYEFAEFVSRREQRGLWQDEEPLPPWEWRKR
jgi:endonuclease YncB( thermonuclease family)